MEELSRDILIKASQGDMVAFEAVYKATASFIYNVAFRVVSNKEDAQELTQEVFMIIHDKLKTFRFESSFKTWVYRITANHSINFAKKNAQKKTVVFEEAFGNVSTPSEVEEKMDHD